MNLIARLFGLKTKKSFGELEVKFHKEAIYFGEHGVIVVSHRKQGLVEQPVSFVMVGITTPPKLDAMTFNLIWEAAKSGGYIPHHIHSYGSDAQIVRTKAPAKNDRRLVLVTAEPGELITSDKVQKVISEARAQ